MTPPRKYAGIASFVAFTVLPLVSSSVFTWYLYQHQDDLAGWGIAGWLLFSLIVAILCGIALVPPTFLAIVMGFFLGWWAFPFLIAINMLAIGLIFLVSRWVDLSWVEAWLRKDPKIADVLTRIKGKELKFIFFTKLSPLFPFAVTNLLFAASGAAFGNILLGGFLGMIPRTALAVYIGSQARELREVIENPNQADLSQWIIGLLLVVSIIGMGRVIKRALK